MTGKTDFDYKIRLDEVPSVELRDWMNSDIVFTLWESRPIFQKVKEEGQEVEVDRVVINEETRVPEIEQNCGIKLHAWLKRSPLVPTYSSNQKKKDKTKQENEEELPDIHIIHQYYYFYESNVLVKPEYVYENKLNQLKPKEVEILVQKLEQ